MPTIIKDLKPMSKPYFEAKNILIYNEDFLRLMTIPKNSIDLIVTSPHYNVDIHYNSHADNLIYEDYLEFTKKDFVKFLNFLEVDFFDWVMGNLRYFNKY